MLSMSKLALLILFLPVSCGAADFLRDPLVTQEIAKLGPEDPNVPRGPLHRPGQPCGACHSPEGIATSFTVAGTVYRDPKTKVPVADVVVLLIDAEGTKFTVNTNCVGNFYVKPNEFSMRPPMWTSVQLGDVPFKMESPFHREVSCAVCHFDPEGSDTAGHLFVADDPTTFASIPLRPCGPSDGVKR
jgi:hypothetical protein